MKRQSVARGLRWCFPGTGSANEPHLTVFLKIVDRDTVDPTMGDPLRLHEEEGKAQSRDLVFPIFCMISKDNEETILEHISPVYQELEKVCAKYPMNDGVAPLPGGPFLLRYGADMKWLWQCLRRGGGCKNVKAFCSFCRAHHDTAIVPNSTKCSNCCEGIAAGGEEAVLEYCYHIERDMEEDVEGVQDKINEILQSIGGDYVDDLERDLGGSNRLCLPAEPQADGGVSDPNCVNYDLRRASFGDNIIFGGRLQSEIAARPGMDFSNLSMASHVTALRDRLVLERTLSLLKIQLSVALPCNLQFYDRKLAVTCILHLELRLGEMMVGMLIKRGIEMALLQEEDQGQAKARRVQVEFVKKANDVIQGTILASVNKSLNSVYALQARSQERQPPSRRLV